MVTARAGNASVWARLSPDKDNPKISAQDKEKLIENLREARKENLDVRPGEAFFEVQNLKKTLFIMEFNSTFPGVPSNDRPKRDFTLRLFLRA